MSPQDSASAGAGEPLGSAADEAVRLVAALRDLVTGPGAEHLATGSAECQVCPVCRAISLLREADPQAVGRAAESVVGMVSTVAAIAEPMLRSFVDTAISTAQSAASRDPQDRGADTSQAPTADADAADAADDDDADGAS